MSEQLLPIEIYKTKVEIPHPKEITERYNRLRLLRNILNDQIESEDISDDKKNILAQRASLKILRLFEVLDAYSELEALAQPQQLARFDELFNSLCESEEARLPATDPTIADRDAFLNDVLPTETEPSVNRIVELPTDAPDDHDSRRMFAKIIPKRSASNRDTKRSAEMKMYDDFIAILKKHPQADIILANNGVRHKLIWLRNEMTRLSRDHSKNAAASQKIFNHIIKIISRKIKHNCNIDLE